MLRGDTLLLIEVLMGALGMFLKLELNSLRVKPPIFNPIFRRLRPRLQNTLRTPRVKFLPRCPTTLARELLKTVFPRVHPIKHLDLGGGAQRVPSSCGHVPILHLRSVSVVD